jgi:catechol 2,3-dioxygenase-like lactoylglutathione lyase family enzyme
MSDESIWAQVANRESEGIVGPADFAGDCRLHISLNVSDLRRSVDFYRIFFGNNPVKVRPGYAKFSVAEPPLNFSVNEFPNDVVSEGHLGVQAKNTRFIRDAHTRLQANGFKLIEEDQVECCYAVQSKFWVADPDGHRWELFVTTEPDASEGCGPDCICHVELERSFSLDQSQAA